MIPNSRLGLCSLDGADDSRYDLIPCLEIQVSLKNVGSSWDLVGQKSNNTGRLGSGNKYTPLAPIQRVVTHNNYSLTHLNATLHIILSTPLFSSSYTKSLTSQ